MKVLWVAWSKNSKKVDSQANIALDVLKIDNLWALENLTRLQLDNNIIEKIENIGFLKNLTWLGTKFKLV